MKIYITVFRLFIAIAIGVSIGVLIYIVLLQWEHWTFERCIPKWLLVVISIASCLIINLGCIALIKRARPKSGRSGQQTRQ